MGILRGILDRIILVGAILTAGCVPSFIAQYRQRVGGMLDQAVRDLAPFQEIARRNFGGDIRKLIQHHLGSTDPTFQQEGRAIEAIVDSVASLKEAITALNADLFGQASWMVRHGDPEVARATWDAFVPAMSLTGEALAFSFGTGISVWLVFLVVWFGTARFLDVVLARGRPGEWSVPRVKRGKEKGHQA
jgi:hypothetical protein